MHLIIKVVLAALMAIVLALALLLYVGAEGVPFVEGDRITTHGDAEGFHIGMSKAQAFDALKIHYHDRNATVRHIWARDSPHADQLSSFEAPQSLEWATSQHGYYEEAIDSLETIPLPLSMGDRWDVRLPASWVHSVYVTFEADRVVEIRHSRWLFERP